jgi:hypothetical protein
MGMDGGKIITKYIDITGEKFGRWTVIERGKNDKNGKAMWLCQCECGSQPREVNSSSLRNGVSNSCGCLNLEKISSRFKLHGKSKTRLNNIWFNMKQRCYNSKNPNYADYGGRGIKICDEWLNDFLNFYNWSIENGHSDELSIERINVNGDYDKHNCKWATDLEQANNKRNNVYITINNVTRTAAQWEKDSGINKSTFRNRIRRGLQGEELLSINRSKNIKL